MLRTSFSIFLIYYSHQQSKQSRETKTPRFSSKQPEIEWNSECRVTGRCHAGPFSVVDAKCPWCNSAHVESNDRAYSCDIFCLAIHTATLSIVNTWYIFWRLVQQCPYDLSCNQSTRSFPLVIQHTILKTWTLRFALFVCVCVCLTYFQSDFYLFIFCNLFYLLFWCSEQLPS